MNHTSRRPGRGMLILGIVLLVLAAAIPGLLAWQMISSLASATERLQRVVVPGQAVLELSEPGPYEIYYEHRSAVDGRVFSTSPTPPNLAVTVRQLGSDQPVPLQSPMTSMNYSVGSFAGIRMFTFQAPQAGAYELAVQYGGSSGPEVVLAVGPPMQLGKAIGAGFAACGAFLLLGGAGLTLLIIALVRWSNAKAPPAAPAA